MAKMSEAQRNAILSAHRARMSGRMGMVTANPRTERVLRREGWVAGAFDIPTRAGLIAAGVNLDKLRDQAKAEWIVRDDDPRDDAVRAEARRWLARGGRGDGLLWAADICRESAHREATTGCLVRRDGEEGARGQPHRHPEDHRCRDPAPATRTRRVTTTMIRFDFGGLSPGMCFVLFWLIDRGGAMSYNSLLTGIKPDAKADGRIVRRNTVDGLIKRGHLEESNNLMRLQVSDWALIHAYRNPDNPNPLPVMRARAEALAHKESATRTADMIKETWANRNTEGDHA